MIASRILLAAIALAISTPGCFDPTLTPDGQDAPVTDASTTHASLGESSTLASGDDVAETSGGESTDESTDDESTADDRPGDPVEDGCGDGLIGAGEECDDANDGDGDGCSACTIAPGWECHDEPSVCVATCDTAPQDCTHL